MFFEYPYLLWLLVLPVLLLALYVYRELKERRPHLRVSTVTPWEKGGKSILGVIRHLPEALRLAALALIIVCIARPRSKSEMERVDTEGIDIVLAVDVSTSMLARDFKPDRLSAAKDISIEFIAQRPTVQTDLIEDGTAIGNGLATAVARMKDSDAKSRVIILLTDGVNNRGEVDPAMAAEIAKTYGIRVYTIGVGREGEAPYPVMTPWGPDVQNMKVEIDEPLLKQIAAETGGKYFRADDNTKLAEIYAEIGRMEKTRTTVDSFPIYKDLFPRYAVWALVCLLLEILIRFLLRRLP